ncbi:MULTISPECIES: hypothetical protein [Thermomonospora]|uniref:Uncharacterized protein n=1 Tax=Thermomonospora curvata (strain ATCC 19995 / DSM 43183 / JCM 3096 / KCTC 9072 / NBRC 15933 / NCIMB 10081 / Henssen B9) TaxID=471852 RepID=D1A9N4_THECD|nr:MULTISPECIES: hypothetical protein [Thermomonospora]ACY98720.1 hypothetical protein Tcur_3179 [Thermomonospora curvata DSM 43183]PKK13840.1 MAG: hypothetical protein BUE48_015505 [Thermomonospora sp. CIF 1]
MTKRLAMVGLLSTALGGSLLAAPPVMAAEQAVQGGAVAVTQSQQEVGQVQLGGDRRRKRKRNRNSNRNNVYVYNYNYNLNGNANENDNERDRWQQHHKWHHHKWHHRRYHGWYDY